MDKQHQTVITIRHLEEQELKYRQKLDEICTPRSPAGQRDEQPKSKSVYDQGRLFARIAKLHYRKYCVNRQIAACRASKLRAIRRLMIVDDDQYSVDYRLGLFTDEYTYDNKILAKIEQDIRSAVQHENELLNHRIQWFLTITGFLLTAVALYGPNAGRDIFCIVIAAIGILVTRSFQVALGIGGKGVRRLSCLWELYRMKAEDKKFPEVGVLGYSANLLENSGAPWKCLPLITYILWVSIVLFGLLNPGLAPSGSYSVNATTNQKQRFVVYDTRTGMPRKNDTDETNVVHKIICNHAARSEWAKGLLSIGTRQCGY